MQNEQHKYNLMYSQSNDFVSSPYAQEFSAQELKTMEFIISQTTKDDIHLAENNSLGILNKKLINYRLHPTQETGGRKTDIEKYIDRNKQLFNDDMEVKTFEDLRFILNKIEINLFIQKQIKKLGNIGFDNENYINILEKKHTNYLNVGFQKWPLLSLLRKIKKGLGL